ncbi:MAG: type II secretion system protein N [Gammaproteobacteria bacterium]|nr:type II secretion system protein N [Gammaproteobacteria bacterium]
MSTRALLALAAILFAFTVLLRAPARWLLATLPPTVECLGPAGTFWSGSCARLRVGAASLSQVSWSLHAAPLLLGRIDVDLRSADALAAGTARVSLRPGGRLVVTALRAALPVDAGNLPFFPAGWNGHLELALDTIALSAGRLGAIAGTATVRGLARRNPPLPFGSYELRFPADSDDARMRGELRDLGGPLAVSGTLSIRNGHEYLLSGLVAARPEASAELSKIIEYIGPADPQGRRAFTLEGSF